MTDKKEEKIETENQGEYIESGEELENHISFLEKLLVTRKEQRWQNIHDITFVQVIDKQNIQRLELSAAPIDQINTTKKMVAEKEGKIVGNLMYLDNEISLLDNEIKELKGISDKQKK